MRPKLITADELAAVLCITADDVQWWSEAGVIPGPVAGDLWDASAIDEALRSPRLAETVDIDDQHRAELQRLCGDQR